MSSIIGEAAIRVRPDTSGFQGETESQLSSTVKHIVGALAAAFAGKKIFDFGKQAVEEAAIVQKSTETIRANFGKSAQSVIDFGHKAADAYGISNEASTAFSASIGIMAQNIHLSAGQAAQMDIGFQQLAGSISAIKGEDPTLVFNTLQTALLGNTRGLKALGIEINTTSEKQAALRLGIKGSSSDWTNAQKALIIYNAAMQNAGKFQEQAKKHGDDLADTSIKLHAQFANLKEEIGQALLPVVARLATFLADKLPGAMHAIEAALVPVQQKLKTFADFISTIAQQPDISLKFKVIFEGIKDAVGNLLGSLRDAIFGTAGHLIKIPTGKVIGFQEGDRGLAQNFKSAMTSAISGIDWKSVGQQIGSSIGKSITFGKNAVQTLLLSFLKAIQDNKTQIADLGILLVIEFFTEILNPDFWIHHWQAVVAVAIAALTIAFGEVRLGLEILGPIAKALDAIIPGLGGAFVKLFGGLGELLLKGVEGLGSIIAEGLGRAFAAAAPEAGSAAARIITAFIEGIRTFPSRVGAVFEAVGTVVREQLVNLVRIAAEFAIRLVQTFIATLRTTPGRAIAVFVAVTAGVVNALSNLLSKAWALAKRIAQAIIDGITGNLGTVGAKVGHALASVATAIFNVAKSAAGWAYNIGRNIVTGVVDGIVNNATSIKDAIVNAAKGALSAAKSALGIGSPSKVFAKEVGEPIAQGVAAGIDSGFAKTIDTLGRNLRHLADMTTTAAAARAVGQPGAAGVIGPGGGSGVHIEHVHISADRPEMFLRELNLVAMRATL